MEKRNLFVSGKAVVAAVCGAFTAAFGWLGWLVVAWAACMALDWVSGSAAAASRGAWSSAAARAGIWHKAGMVVVVLVCALTDAVLAVAVANLPGLGLEVNGVVLPVVALLNFLVFIWPAIDAFIQRRKYRHAPQTVNFKKAVRQQQQQKGYHHKCAVCGRTEVDHPELEFRYCSRCVGYHCFCQDHINNHVHFTE